MAFELTRGQPWLVNALARQMIETVVPDRRNEITPEHLLLAKEILIRRRDTHIDSLLDRLRENRVRRVLEPILAGADPDPEVFDDDYQFVEALGLVALGERGLEIANPIYNEIIPRALTAVAERFVPMRRAAYVREDGRLDWDALLDGFTAFWKRNAEWMLRQQPYSEAAAQLVFMAFLHRLVNGPELDLTGRIATVDREFAVGSGRVDLLVRWPVSGHETQCFAVEMKVRRDKDGDPLDAGARQAGPIRQQVLSLRPRSRRPHEPQQQPHLLAPFRPGGRIVDRHLERWSQPPRSRNRGAHPLPPSVRRFSEFAE